MLDETTIEQRFLAIEKAISDIQLRLAERPVPPNWLDQVTGSITDEEAFREALALGREFRMADRPPDEPDHQP